MATIIVQATEELGYENGDTLELENGDLLALERTISEDQATVVEDGSEAVEIYTQDSYLWFQYEYPTFFFEAEPVHFFEVAWTPGIGQQEPLALMPIYDERFLGGDIANILDFWLQTFSPAHFGPDGTSDFAGPAEVEILEGSASFEIGTEI